jgi:uncharacterized protein (TIGR02145 family)
MTLNGLFNQVLRLLLLVFLCNCGGDNSNPTPVTTPSVVTLNITDITRESAVVNGEVTSDGNGKVIERGIVIRATPDPTTADTKVVSGLGVGTFSVTLNNLTAVTVYNIRTYAINSAGTAYGLNKSFNTTLVPTITTLEVTSITNSSAQCGGNITSDGGAEITSRGVCWDTKTNPTVLNTKTTDGTGLGTFSSAITGLKDGTIYYLRSYATNSAGTAYGTEVVFNTGSNSAIDTDGNIYQTVTYSDKVWMTENLRTGKYRNGEPIAEVTNRDDWSVLLTGAYANYNNDATNSNIYARLYNWYAVNDIRGICPVGWHVATDADWTTLVTFLGGELVAGGKMKTTGTSNWQSPNKGATNASDFNGLPGGGRSNFGIFGSIGFYGLWWTSSQLSNQFAYYWFLDYSSTAIGKSDSNKNFGYSVRCVRN